MENIVREFKKFKGLLENYLFSENLKIDCEGYVIENVKDPVKLVARLERTSAKFQQRAVDRFMAMVDQMSNVYELISLWRQIGDRKFNQIDFRNVIEKRMNFILKRKKDKDFGEMLEYLGKTPICSNPQKIILGHLKRVLKGNVRLIKEVIINKLELPYNLKDFFTQEVARTLLGG